MVRKSRTELAVLGALSIKPMSGYAVRQAIDETLGHFWRESFGQIYPTLARLESEGLIRRDGAGATSGSVFALTEPGRVRLGDLLAEPVEQSAPRDPLLLRLFFGRQLGPAACRALLEEAASRAEALLIDFDRIEAEEADNPSPDAPYWRMTLAAGRHAARARIHWAREALELLPTI